MRSELAGNLLRNMRSAVPSRMDSGRVARPGSLSGTSFGTSGSIDRNDRALARSLDSFAIMMKQVSIQSNWPSQRADGIQNRIGHEPRIVQKSNCVCCNRSSSVIAGKLDRGVMDHNRCKDTVNLTSRCPCNVDGPPTRQWRPKAMRREESDSTRNQRSDEPTGFVSN